MMNIVLIIIKHIAEKLIEAWVMKRKIPELKAHKHHRFFLSNMLSAFKELLLLIVKIYFLNAKFNTVCRILVLMRCM